MKFVTALLLVLSFNLSLAQSPEVVDFIEKGIAFHDNGDYASAIAEYKKALEIEPKSSLIHYELSLSYFYKKEFKDAIKHADVVIKNDDKYVKEAYITKGSCLDNLGKTKESIKLFKKGIRKFPDVLLYYNLALNYYKLKEFEDAEKYVTLGIAQKADHASSHLLLGYLNFDKDYKVQSLLNLHYFLLLEPTSSRSPRAVKLIKTMMSANVTKDEDDPKSVTINLSLPSKDNEFGAAEMMLGLLEASKSYEENEGKSDDEMFVENTDSFFTILGELQDKKKKKGIYWDVYVPLFYDLAKSDHMEAYCNYITQSANENYENWVDNNSDKLDALADWFSKK
ncbi:tetratricopeptide repeat protein [uncultured Psychroserpens sp.]|uniref:tetratricopeptide repeat protein n=1 Tax=uncultured Psychroserpens sp. TaxID=255436 RepID=UPI002629C193|nr:tetratricopeptide repeat protein [uncultured Psychroserpens sp.]